MLFLSKIDIIFKFYSRDNEDLVHKVTQPVMFVNTESFLNEDNLKKMETFAQADKMERICYYIQGSVHQNHIDAPFLIRVCVIRVTFNNKIIKLPPVFTIYCKRLL